MSRVTLTLTGEDGMATPSHTFAQDAPLLTTKLFVSPARPGLVLRPRLVERLSAGLRQVDGFTRKLTLICAPAGFGKTTLVREWVENLRLKPFEESQIENRTAWLSLDTSDNDPARFLDYFIVALNRAEGIETTIGKGARSMLQSPQPPPTEEILISLINDVAAITDRIILVLDDYHEVESRDVHEAVSYLARNLPEELLLVIVTRADPPLPVSWLRGRDRLREIRSADLRFTVDQVADAARIGALPEHLVEMLLPGLQIHRLGFGNRWQLGLLDFRQTYLLDEAAFDKTAGRLQGVGVECLEGRKRTYQRVDQQGFTGESDAAFDTGGSARLAGAMPFDTPGRL